MWSISLAVVTVSLAIYAMISISMSRMEKKKKIVWFAFAALVPLIGPAIYFFTRPDRMV